MLIAHFGSGIWSQIRWRTGSIFIATRPATIIRSHCRGLNRMTSAPNRAMSNRLAPTAISSIPQQAVANGIGQRLYFRHQFTTASSVVRIVFSGTSIAPFSSRPGAIAAAEASGDGVPGPSGMPIAIRTPLFARRRDRRRTGQEQRSRSRRRPARGRSAVSRTRSTPRPPEHSGPPVPTRRHSTAQRPTGRGNSNSTSNSRKTIATR